MKKKARYDFHRVFLERGSIKLKLTKLLSYVPLIEIHLVWTWFSIKKAVDKTSRQVLCIRKVI